MIWSVGGISGQNDSAAEEISTEALEQPELSIVVVLAYDRGLNTRPKLWFLGRKWQILYVEISLVLVRVQVAALLQLSMIQVQKPGHAHARTIHNNSDRFNLSS